jgi:hypothetical protein
MEANPFETQENAMSVFEPIQVPFGQPAGAWSLRPGAVMSLQSDRACWLRVVHGTAWVTVGAPDGGTPEASGDLFLQAGDVLSVPAATRVVLESDARGGEQIPVRFDWVEQPAAFGRFGQALAEGFKGFLAHAASLVGAPRGARPCLASPRHR